MMHNKSKRNIGIILPFCFLIILFILFSIINGKAFLNLHNIKTIVDRMIPLCIGGYGLLFVISQGSIDISTGSNLSFTAIFSAIIASKLGNFMLLPACIIVASLVGLVNGLLVSKLKVNSVMATIAQTIVLGSFVVLLTHNKVIYVNPAILKLNQIEYKLFAFLIATFIAVTLFEYTKLGYSSRYIGENEVACEYIGLKTKKIKTLAFVLCGAFVGLSSFLTIAQIGGVSSQMGASFGLQVMMVVYVGGVPVQGGSKSRVIKVIIGALLMSILQSGLVIANVGSEMVELIQGILLMAMVTFMLKADQISAAEDEMITEIE